MRHSDGADVGRCSACAGRLTLRRAVRCRSCGERTPLPPAARLEPDPPRLRLARGLSVRVPLGASPATRLAAIRDRLAGLLDCPDCDGSLRVTGRPPRTLLACTSCSTAFRLPPGRFVGRCGCGLPWVVGPVSRCLDPTCPVARLAERGFDPGRPPDSAGAGHFRSAGVETVMRVLSDADVADLVDLTDVLPAVERGVIAQGRGTVERPDRPHFPVGVGLETDGATDDPAGTGLAMPAYIHGDQTYATKLVGVHPANAGSDLPTVQAQLVVSQAATGEPALLAAAERLTNARTGAIGGLAARELAPAEPTVGVIGAGTQARWQSRAIAETRGVDRLRCYSPTPASRTACAADLRRAGIDARAVESAERAVEGADVVVTATTASEPVVAGETLEPGALVVAVGAYTADTQELDRTTFDRADRVYADVPSEVAEIGDVATNEVDPDRLASLSVLFDERATDPHETGADDGLTVVESVGSAVFDAALGELLYDADESVGTTVEL